MSVLKEDTIYRESFDGMKFCEFRKVDSICETLFNLRMLALFYTAYSNS